MKIIKSIINSIPIAPILFAVSFVLVLFSHNKSELTVSRIILPVLAVVFFSLTVYLFSVIFFINREKRIIFSSVFMILFFSYGELLSIFGNIHIDIGRISIGKNNIIFTVLFIILLLLHLFIKRTKKHLNMYSKYLTIISLIAVFIPISGILKYEINRAIQTRPENPLALSKINISSLDRNNLPDIYYIISDSYASEDILKKYFNYDNNSFISFLENKGFYVAGKSTSNYPKTFLSLASSLNMQYLDHLSKYKNSTDQTLTDRMIENNNVLSFLKSLGYYYYQMGSWWGSTHYNRLADNNFILENTRLGDIGEFNYMIINSSMLSPLISKFFPQFFIGESEDDKRARVLYQFEKLPNITKQPSPKFIFVHIITPHGPYVFGKNCEFVTYEQIWYLKEEDNYANQVNCINHKLEETINAILKNSVNPPVILLQADEGANFLSAKLNPPENWKNANTDLLKEKFPILSAYYISGMPKSLLYQSITPVNSFRVIFNHYFSVGLPLLPDKNYIFQDANHLYEFIDVTDKLRN